MRINEELPVTQGETSCPVDGCNKMISQCVDVTAPLSVTPSATVGAVTVACQGAPRVSCTAGTSGTACTITVTQQVCLTIPVRYGISVCAGDTSVSCAESRGCGCR